jgi:excinuclease ABC subunit A
MKDFGVMGKDVIRIVGARQHNLKNLTLTMPRDRLVVVTGLSGSGKSSLAFDTIFAEGQRKYVESLSAYARQFLDQLQKPDVDYIEGLSPTIAIEQRTAGANPRSIIATTTEIFDYLRLLYAHAGQPHCPVSGQPISRQTTSEVVDQIAALPLKTRVMVLAPVVRQQKGEFRDVLERLSREGFVRVRVDGEIVELSPEHPLRLEAKQTHEIDVVVDRLVIDDKVRIRLADSVETALQWGEGRLVLLYQLPEASASTAKPAAGAAKAARGATEAVWLEKAFSNRLFSPATGLSYEPPGPKHFSFNSPQGACPRCHGLGQKMVLDPSLIVPVQTKSLEQGAILSWRRGGQRMILYYKSLLKAVAKHYGQNMEVPYQALPEDFKTILMWGSGETEIDMSFFRAGKTTRQTKPFEGVIPNMERLFVETESEFTKNRLKAFMSPAPCDACFGQRLKPEILAVTLPAMEGDKTEPPAPGSIPAAPGDGSHIAAPENPLRKAPGMSIMDVCGMPIDRCGIYFDNLKLTEFQAKIASEILREIRVRLGFLKNVGLGYLTLNRESGTLSGGEAQRIRLATQIGAGLVGVLYILDEPSIGLHQRDNERLLKTLIGLRDLGNTVIVVEHDEDTIRSADYVVDLGPGAGVRGGELVAAGTPAEIMAHPKSLTGRYLSGDLSIPVPKKRNAPSRERGWIEILGARENNLRNIDVRIPLNTLCCVTGVSGSGKSTLVDDILRRALFRHFFSSKERPGAHREILGLDKLEKVVVVDQAPIGRTPRSNPATYTGMFDHIRHLFSQMPSAKVRGYSVGRFSFNVRGGRCEKCQGDGLIKIEMNFLPPVYVTCESCGGKRYNRESLEITYKGKNIADVLAMTVDEAVDFFRAIPSIHDVCLTLAEVGLGYVGLGQAATTLSGGEAQRIKLASELSRRSNGRTLYILDEPTTGLHFHDVAKLLEVLFKLRATGNTLIVIEHNLDVIKNADWIIDLGPEGGSGGGRILAQGTPEHVAQCAQSYTGQFLNKLLKTRSS